METPLEGAIRSLKLAEGSPAWWGPLSHHARRVLEENDRLHLTTITDPEQFARRHVEESLAGLQAISPGASGALLDLGSGNGYPAIPLALARPNLRVTLAEASRSKAEFLKELVEELGLANAQVLHRHLQRPGDLPEPGPYAFITTRAMGNWERVLPRLASVLDEGGRVLLWAGNEVEKVRCRAVWQRYRLAATLALPGLDQGFLYTFERN